MAGVVDKRPARNVLTSLLNGVPPYKADEKGEELRRVKKKEKWKRDKVRKRELAALRVQEKQPVSEPCPKAGRLSKPSARCARVSGQK